jgi:ketosteroid isomerase-like protein
LYLSKKDLRFLWAVQPNRFHSKLTKFKKIGGYYMIEKLPEEVQKVFKEVLAAETEISSGDPGVYNSYIADSEYATSVSASGRFMKGTREVREATVAVSLGNLREHDRLIEWISCDFTDDMAYAVFKSGVSIDKEDGKTDDLCWIVTLILKKTESGWKLVHRHNTRSKR